MNTAEALTTGHGSTAQGQADQPQVACVGDPFADQVDHSVMVDCVKHGCEIDIYRPIATDVDKLVSLGNGVSLAATGPVTKARLGKLRVEDRLQHQFQRLLQDTVTRFVDRKSLAYASRERTRSLRSRAGVS
ncbi:MAG: hypothetical protein ACI8W8_001263 [Rhodothermales bacterium]|jgi:hypothetical protein